MTLQYLHGIETVELDDGLRPIETVRSAVIGIIGTAPDADVDLFPLNEPVLIPGTPSAAAALGLTGTLPDGLDAIFDNGSCTVIVVRVDPGVSVDTAFSAIIGNSALKTGVWAFRKAQAKFGLTPKLLVAPGYTSQRPTNGIASITLNTPGTGYVSASTVVTLTGGGGSGAAAKAIVNTDGTLAGIVLTKRGYGYTSAPTVAITGVGLNAAATAVTGAVGNPVVAELLSLAPQIRAIVGADGPGTTYEAAVAYRNDWSDMRLHIIDGGCMVWDTQVDAAVLKPASARWAGGQAVMDQKRGFWWAFSNQTLPGIVGVGRPIDWSFYDPNLEGQLLNEMGVSVVVHDEGYRLMGMRSATSDPKWRFYSVRRTADMVYESIEKTLKWAVDRPISVNLILEIEESVNAYLRLLKQYGAILGGRAWLDRAVNTPAELMQGKLTIDFDIEPPAGLEHLIFRARRNAGYYTEMVENAIRQATLIQQ
ncbi:phage tail sheath C-terminal domain-containing protein [Phreatobacter sp. HK31-P]